MADEDRREDAEAPSADPLDASALGERFRAYLAGKRRHRVDPHVNHASDLGWPCERQSVLKRLRPYDAALPSIALQGIFAFGQDYEHMLRQRLWGAAGAGYRFRQEQERLDWARYQITGTPEGQISADDGETWHLFEVKGLHPNYWNAITTWRDFLKTPLYSRYVAQGQMYLLLWNRGNRANQDRLLFIIGRKGSYDLKWLWMPLDEDLAETYLQKAERINAHVAANTLPDRITDRSVCGLCDFAGTCLPNQDYGPGAEFVADPDLIADLEQRAKLAPLAREYDAVDRRIKARVEGRTLVIAGSWALEGRECSRTDRPRPGGTIKWWQTRIRSLTSPSAGGES